MFARNTFDYLLKQNMYDKNLNKKKYFLGLYGLLKGFKVT